MYISTCPFSTTALCLRFDRPNDTREICLHGVVHFHTLDQPDDLPLGDKRADRDQRRAIRRLREIEDSRERRDQPVRQLSGIASACAGPSLLHSGRFASERRDARGRRQHETRIP